MKTLSRLKLKELVGGIFELEFDVDGCGVKTGDRCEQGQKCCDPTKGDKGNCPSVEDAKCN